MFCVDNTQELTDWGTFSNNDISPGIGISYGRGISYSCHDEMFPERFAISSGGRRDIYNNNLSYSQRISYGCHGKRFHRCVVISYIHRSSFAGRSAVMHLNDIYSTRIFFAFSYHGYTIVLTILAAPMYGRAGHSFFLLKDGWNTIRSWLYQRR